MLAALFAAATALASPGAIESKNPLGHAPTCATPPANGAVLEGGETDPLIEANRLTIENGARGNAIVKVRDAATNRLFVSFFVARRATATYAYIPDGRYVIQYAFGHRLNAACTRFLVMKRAARNPQIETFSTSDSEIHQVLRLQLYPVPKGNLKPLPIDEAAFNSE